MTKSSRRLVIFSVRESPIPCHVVVQGGDNSPCCRGIPFFVGARCGHRHKTCPYNRMTASVYKTT
jgi:hypothetical protein